MFTSVSIQNLPLRTLLMVLFAMLLTNVNAQRKMETLDRGLVAVKVNNGVFLSWRIFGDEWYGTNYNIYRDGEKLNGSPLEISNFTDTQGTLASNYTVSSIIDGTEQAHCSPASPLQHQYKEIILKPRNTAIYEINDATAADLDGDGQYEIIVKRIAKGWNEDNTNYTYFEAYKQDGTFLWEINVGPNILPDVEINIAAFDFDEDGKAEVFMRTSEGTIFGDGTQIGDTDNDGITNYRYSVGTTPNLQYMNEGPEFLSLIDGLTGAELDRIDFIPRINSGWWWPENPTKAYGHRASKYFFGAPYLDGIKPSLFIGRGIYTKTVMRTYDIVDKKLQLRWEWSATSTGDPYYGQGNHNYTIADVDGDGRDEIVWGSMAIDDDGTGLYSTQLGHGDAMHVGDLDPFRKGMEAFRCLENYPVHGTVLHDAATGEILIHHMIDKDCGRCCAANISDDIKGKALWGGAKLFSASTLQQEGTGSLAENFRIYWDGDLLEELLDHTGFTTTKGYGTGAILKHGKGNIFTAHGAISNNYTKGTPSLQADLFGDWREEVIWRNEANTAIRIYTTVDPTIYRNYTLMHDHQYRQAICWQMCGYNQPPHVSYFLGESEGFTTPPPPSISNNRLVYNGTGSWNKSDTNWKLDGNNTAYSDGKHVLFDISAGDDVAVELSETLSPSVLTVNSPGNYSINAAQGKLSGNMQLAKQGLGSLSLNGKHDYTGSTEIWGGQMHFEGTLENSPVNLLHFGELYASGKLQNSVNMRYGSILEMGMADSTATLHIENGLTMENGAIIVFDLYAPTSQRNDSLNIKGTFSFNEPVIFNIIAHHNEGENKLAPGDYLLATVNGNIDGDIEKIIIEGILGTPAKLKMVNGNLTLEIKAVRSSTSIEWNGDKAGSIWDLAQTENFRNNGMSDIFVDQDQVIFNDQAYSKAVNINMVVTPSSILVDASENFTFQGIGSIAGTATLTKSGTGTLAINNINSFTGKVLVNEGTLMVPAMPTAQSNGNIGAATADASKLELNGGTLVVSSEGNSDRAMNIGSNGGTLSNSGKLQWNERISGGTLIKRGTGNLILAGINTHTSTVLTEGTITLLNDETNPGKTIYLEGGTLQCSDNSGTYNTMSWNIDVPEGKNANIKLDSRGFYTGKLTGSGTLNVYIPFVRSDLDGDMSEFSGTLSFYSSTGSGVELRINNSKGLPNAHVVVNSAVSTSNTRGTSIILGALSGIGNLDGEEHYQIGAKNTDSQFDGKITSGSLTKVGTGAFALSNSNTYSGETIINRGTLIAANKTGSATGSGDVSVRILAELSGEGLIAGNVSVESGAKITPGTTNVGRFLTINKSLNLKKGSILEVKSNPLFKYIDYLKVDGTINISGKLKINNTTSRDYSPGDEFKLFDCANITGQFESISPETPGEGLLWDMSELESKGIIKVTKATSIATFKNPNFSVFPNPFRDELNIKINDELNSVVSITDLLGNTLFIENLTGTNTHKIDLSHLQAGLYFVNVKTINEIYHLKIIKE